ERSPVKTRPVRFPPCAAGASPSTSTRARGSPKPGTGRPQYSSSRNAARFVHATSSRHATSRGHARQPVMSASSRAKSSRVTALACPVVRVLLIVNTTASSVTARKRVLIQKTLGAVHDLETMETSRRGHAARIARGAARRGVEVVAVLGGDGTLNEA